MLKPDIGHKLDANYLLHSCSVSDFRLLQLTLVVKVRTYKAKVKDFAIKAKIKDLACKAKDCLGVHQNCGLIGTNQPAYIVLYIVISLSVTGHVL